MTEESAMKEMEEIRQTVLAFDGVLGVHDLIMHQYGPNKRFVTVHVEIDARMTGILVAHLITAAIGIPLGLATYNTVVTSQDLILILILGVVQLGIPYVLYAMAASRISPLSCSLIGMIEPLLNPIWVAVFYGEIPGLFALIGGVVVIVSVVVYNVWDEKQSSL